MLLLACSALSPPISRRSALGSLALPSTLALPSAATLSPAAASAAVAGEREVETTVDVSLGRGPPTRVTRRRYTGAGDPSWNYARRDLTPAVFRDWPSDFPYTGADDFKRLDEAVDTEFYKLPKLVYHIDEGAVAALTHFYDESIPDGSDVLDICSSWVSHFPRDFPLRMRSIVGTGISDLELQCNDQLSGHVQADLNVAPRLPFPDRSFDVVTCCVSFDYLTRPLDVMREVRRVLRPGGSVLLSQSNRCFFTKAVGVWTRDMSDAAHLRVLGTYIHFAGGLSPPAVTDISASGTGTNDPMYLVSAKRE